jgi:hypothetical protein
VISPVNSVSKPKNLKPNSLRNGNREFYLGREGVVRLNRDISSCDLVRANCEYAAVSCQACQGSDRPLRISIVSGIEMIFKNEAGKMPLPRKCLFRT